MVRSGLDRWLANGFSALRGKTVGAIVNPTSLDHQFNHLADLLARSEGVRLGALFGPEHGVRGEAQYMVGVEDGRDPRTGVPVHSLYGATFESLRPKEASLDGLEALVFDIQDVGSRYYTYIYTMALAMKAVANQRIPFYVLDRPNPIDGVHVEGNFVEPRFRSFVGLFGLPNRHGMTVGELAQLFNAEEGIGCDLHVVRCEGWKRGMCWEATGRSFVPPSPNMPTPDTALVYPGMCLFEGTNVSEGRGTCRPFEQFGSPWLDGDALADHLKQEDLPGVRFRSVRFTPMFDKYANQSCGGVMMHVVDPQAFRPVATGIAAVKACRELGGQHFAWRTSAYEFVQDIPAFDLLCGTDRMRRGIEAGDSLSVLLSGFENDMANFHKLRKPYLMYDD